MQPDKEQSPSVTELVDWLRDVADPRCQHSLSRDALLEAAARLEALHAEREKLREALERFTGQAVFDPHTHRVSVDEFVVSKARTALNASPKDSPDAP